MTEQERHIALRAAELLEDEQRVVLDREMITETATGDDAGFVALGPLPRDCRVCAYGAVLVAAGEELYGDEIYARKLSVKEYAPMTVLAETVIDHVFDETREEIVETFTYGGVAGKDIAATLRRAT